MLYGGEVGNAFHMIFPFLFHFSVPKTQFKSPQPLADRIKAQWQYKCALSQHFWRPARSVTHR